MTHVSLTQEACSLYPFDGDVLAEEGYTAWRPEKPEPQGGRILSVYPVLSG